MDVARMLPGNAKVIEAYDTGWIKVGGEIYRAPIAVHRDRVLDWPLSDPAAPQHADFRWLADLQDRPEILVLGTGGRARFLPPALRDALRRDGVVCEVMATPAACRTYNVLLAEDRLVAAALIPVE